jgi:hypothetical protein
MLNADAWAADEFGAADLGDRRRTRRLVRLATQVALRPAGTVTGSCQSSASREGAFRWLENPAIRAEAVEGAMALAALRRCRGARLIHVPIDGTALTLKDARQAKGLGAVGSWKNGARGVQVMTALALDRGTPLGIVGQRMWVRERPSKRPEKAHSAQVHERETRFWLELLQSTHEAFAAQAPEAKAFYQLDRGADCWPVLTTAIELNLLLTVRAAHNRRVDTRAGALWDEVSRARVRDTFRMHVPARLRIWRRKRQKGRRVYVAVVRRARVAELTVRACTVPLLIRDGRRITVQAVLVREKGRREDDRIEWLLLSTHPIRTKADVRAIVGGYTQRWKIEEFHRTWKRGLCRVEDTQLRSRSAIFKWATILASVASRALHLTHSSRSEPDAPATKEFTRYELDALIALRQPKGIKLGAEPTLAEAVRWIADLGGYVGPWNGPPGPKVIGRGLEGVLAAAAAFESRDKMR